MLAVLTLSCVTLLEVPAYAQPVLDSAGVLQPEQAQELTQLLQSMHKSGRVSMAVWLLDSTEGEAIEDLADRTFKAWQLGSRGVDQGLLFVVAVGNRTSRMEVGYGLEGELTDAFTRRLQDNTVRPYFRAEQYGDGVMAAALGVAAQLRIALPDALTQLAEPQESHSDLPKEMQFLLPWILLMFAAPFVLGPLAAFTTSLPKGLRRALLMLLPVDIVALFFVVGYATKQPVIMVIALMFAVLTWMALRSLRRKGLQMAKGSGENNRGDFVSEGTSSSSNDSSFSDGGRSGGGGSTSRW